MVNLQDRTCNCRAWAISGIPCMHAMAAISYQRDDLEKYCHQFLTTEAYLRTYSENINPMPDEVTWPVVEHDPILPPLITRMPGRPKKNRRREPNEPPPTSQSKRSTTLRCCICKDFGHNKRTCPRYSFGPSGSSNERGTRQGRGTRGSGQSSSQVLVFCLLDIATLI